MVKSFYQVFGAVAGDSLIPLKALSSGPIYSLPSNLVFASFLLVVWFCYPALSYYSGVFVVLVCRLFWVSA